MWPSSTITWWRGVPSSAPAAPCLFGTDHISGPRLLLSQSLWLPTEEACKKSELEQTTVYYNTLSRTNYMIWYSVFLMKILQLLLEETCQKSKWKLWLEKSMCRNEVRVHICDPICVCWFEFVMFLFDWYYAKVDYGDPVNI